MPEFTRVGVSLEADADASLVAMSMNYALTLEWMFVLSVLSKPRSVNQVSLRPTIFFPELSNRKPAWLIVAIDFLKWE